MELRAMQAHLYLVHPVAAVVVPTAAVGVQAALVAMERNGLQAD